jgi:hypothetical protein
MRGLTSTILLVIALAGLGGYIYFVDNKRPATDVESKPKAFTVAADDIEEIQIRVADGDSTRAQRADKAWKLVEPTPADGDSSELSNMASSLASLDVQRVVEESAADLSQYGLNPPKIEIAFRAKGQTEPMRLQVGDKTPTGGDVYAKKPGESRVFLVTATLNDTFNRTAFDLRDKTVLRFDRDKVDGLEIARTGITMQFARKGADWSIVKPAPMRADYAAIEGLITSMSATLMQKYVGAEATPAELRQYGLDKPSITASVLMGNDRTTLVLGRTDNAETYAKEASRPAIVMVAPTIVSDLSKPLTDFRRKELFDLRSFSTKRIELKRGAETFVFEKATDKDAKEIWKNGSGTTVDTAKVEDLLTKISNLRASSFDDRVDPALKMPALSVTASFGENKDENRSETVSIARAGSSVVASRTDEPGSVRIEGATFDEVMKALDALK